MKSTRSASFIKRCVFIMVVLVIVIVMASRGCRGVHVRGGISQGPGAPGGGSMAAVVYEQPHWEYMVIGGTIRDE